MSLLDEISAERRHNGAQCSYPALLATLSPEVADELDKAVRDRAYQIPAIMRACAKRDIAVNKSMIERHRANECVSCRS